VNYDTILRITSVKEEVETFFVCFFVETVFFYLLLFFFDKDYVTLGKGKVEEKS